ncbi:hypothetical protein H2204_008881 [Knufia peltigerae]|uniref:Maltose/galactoside acetyltransferase domain-containing protein n=1 Tax=Knufia peltigerae TaxID=1002370 RepID=A0AA38Y0E9_9EURO|nr:hypothetical protein H2204_008881 [Knufia peltigerae]
MSHHTNAKAALPNGQDKNQEIIKRARELNHVPWCEQYDSFVPELKEARLRARKLTKKYNDHLPEDATVESLTVFREDALGQLLGKVGKDCWIEPTFFFDYGCNISIGDRFYGNSNLVIIDCGLVTIGDRVMFGPGVNIYTATHETEVQSRRQDIEFAKEVRIGNDCWIGGCALILPGVTIGDGCTIGAGSVVTHDIPPFSVAVGSPARVIKKVTVC